MSGSVDSAHSSHRLNFCEAMTQFKLMFPDIDEKVIEAVLRANRGAVVATVDQLLTMNIDSDGPAAASDGPRPQSSAKVNRILELIGRDRLLTSGTSESSYDNDSVSDLSRSILSQLFGSKSSARSSVDSKAGNHGSERAESCGLSSLSADMSEDFVLLETTTDESQVFSGSIGDGAVGCFGLTPSNGSWDDSGFLPPTPAPPIPPRLPRAAAPPLPPNMSLMLSMAAGSGYGTDENPMSCDLKKKWNPPLLGDLPDDFLRLDIGPQTRKSLGTASAPTDKSTMAIRSAQDTGMPSGDLGEETLPLPIAKIQPFQPSSEAGRGRGSSSADNVI